MTLNSLILTGVVVAIFSTACTATGDSKSAGSEDKVAARAATDKSKGSSGKTQNEYQMALTEAKAAQKKRLLWVVIGVTLVNS